LFGCHFLGQPFVARGDSLSSLESLEDAVFFCRVRLVGGILYVIWRGWTPVHSKT
jgi:hypothetical protein